MVKTASGNKFLFPFFSRLMCSQPQFNAAMCNTTHVHIFYEATFQRPALNLLQNLMETEKNNFSNKSGNDLGTRCSEKERDTLPQYGC